MMHYLLCHCDSTCLAYGSSQNGESRQGLLQIVLSIFVFPIILFRCFQMLIVFKKIPSSFRIRISEYECSFRIQLSSFRIQVSEYNRMVSEYNRPLSEYNRPVSEYNRLVSECIRGISEYNRRVSDQNFPNTSVEFPNTSFRICVKFPNTTVQFLNTTV